MCKFAQTVGLTKGVGKYEDVVATQFSEFVEGVGAPPTSPLSFRGAREASEPGIHNHELCEISRTGVMDSGQPRFARFPE